MDNTKSASWTDQEVTECFQAITSCVTPEMVTAFIQRRSQIRDPPIRLFNIVSSRFDYKTLDGQYIGIFNPRTGSRFGELPCSGPREVEDATRAAKESFKSWKQASRYDRAQHLRRISKVIREKRDAFAAWESFDQGKTLQRARSEVLGAIAHFE
jgi:NAD-dependent aldehyde dehydrogenases